MSFIFITFFLCLLGLLYIYVKHKYNYWKKKGVPFRKPLFPFGNFLELALYKENQAKYYSELYNEFDTPYIGFYSLLTPCLFVKDIDLIKTILVKEFNTFPNRSFFADEKIDPVISNALVAIKVPHWKELRKKLSPVFTSGKMKMMAPLIIECGKNLENYIATMLNQNIEIKDIAARYTTDVISSCAFGLEANSFKENSEFRYYGKLLFPSSAFSAFKSMTYLFAPSIVKIFKYTLIDEKPANFFRKVFNNTLLTRERTKQKRNDFIDILNEIKNTETSDDSFKFEGDRIFAQALIFFGAGHETTSATIAFTLHELSVNLDVQETLRTEILKVIEKHGEITYDAIQEMRYLHMVVSETLRKYPLMPFINRQAVKDYMYPETGLVIEKGTNIFILKHALHFDPKYFPNPNKFDPERFNDDNRHKIPSSAYLAFGDGPRNCIGERFGLLSSKLGIISILRKFKVQKNAQTRDPLIFSRSPLLQSKYGIPITCTNL